MSKTALMLQHDRIGPCGSFGDWARERGYDPQVLHAAGLVLEEEGLGDRLDADAHVNPKGDIRVQT